MKHAMLILLCLLAIGCKKEPAVAEKPLKKFKHEMKGLAIDSSYLARMEDSVLLTFYRMHGLETVWSTPEMRKNAASLLSTSAKEGLEPNDYGVNTIAKLEQKIDDLDEDELIDYDILITKSLQKYAMHLSRGKLRPGKLYWNWDLRPNIVDINLRISEGIDGDSLETVFNHFKPTHETYAQLKTALAIVNEYPDDRKLKKIPFDGKITRKDTSRTMIDIKKRLIYWKDLRQQDSLSPVYDRRTFKAVKRFQMRHGLSADGVIGKGTVAALNFTKEQRRRQIVANLERWRWFPRNFGPHYVIINIPGYVLRVVKDGDTIDEKRIVVGKNERRTPVLSSKFNNIVFNPTWTVPPTIVREDLTPDATKDRSYFTRKEITIYNYKGDTVLPENWKPEKFKSYRYVQSPGDHNSLGNVKFNFPNRFTVYLHDTNHRDYFQKSFRSLSSGCVRVQDPLPLAAYMLSDSIRWPIDSILAIIETRKTTIVPLREKIKIHQLYWTAWSEYNILVFRDDIYNLDQGLYEALRK